MADQAGTALAARDESIIELGSGETLARPVAPADQLRQALADYEAVCTALLRPEDYAQMRGRDGKMEDVPTKMVYGKLGLAYGVSAHIKAGYPIRHHDDAGRLIAAECIVVASAGNREVEGYGACSIEESTYTKPDGTPIPSTRSKAFHNIPSTAETRAYNRAVGRLLPWDHKLRLSMEEAEGGYADEDGSPAPTSGRAAQRSSSGNGGRGNAGQGYEEHQKEMDSLFAEVATALGVTKGALIQEVGRECKVTSPNPKHWTRQQTGQMTVALKARRGNAAAPSQQTAQQTAQQGPAEAAADVVDAEFEASESPQEGLPLGEEV